MGIRFASLPLTDEFFAWTPKASGAVLHFAITRLNLYLTAIDHPVTYIDLGHPFVMDTVRQNGIEPEHLDRIPVSRLADPVILLDWGDGTHVLADGGHRIVKASLVLGRTEAPAWLTPARIWRRFVIEGMPGETADWRDHLRAENPLS